MNGFNNYDVVIDKGRSPVNDQIVEYLKPRITAPYLDIGCNVGYLLREVPGGVGIDASPLLSHGFGRRVWGRAEQLPFVEDMFQTVVLSCVLEQCPDVRSVILEALRVCRWGGKVIGVNPIPGGSQWGVVGNWVQAVIPAQTMLTYVYDPEGSRVENMDSQRYYFEMLKS